MPRYVAFLRGVSPMNAKMPELARAFEGAGFTNVRTVQTSGNVVFESAAADLSELESRAEEAMARSLDRTFVTFVRSADYLRTMLDAEHYAPFALSPKDKCIVAFLRQPPSSVPALPVVHREGRILTVAGTEAFAAYLPSDKAPSFMHLLERTFGKDITTRTVGTILRTLGDG